MSDDFTSLQEAARANLVENDFLAPIAMIVEELGSVQDKIAKSLARSGVKAGDTQKSGLAILLLTPKGRAADDSVSEAQITTLRISLFCNPIINAGGSGHQKPPLAVLKEIITQMLSWNRGPANQPVKLVAWDSVEAATGELSYFADFEVFHVLI